MTKINEIEKKKHFEQRKSKKYATFEHFKFKVNVLENEELVEKTLDVSFARNLTVLETTTIMAKYNIDDIKGDEKKGVKVMADILDEILPEISGNFWGEGKPSKYLGYDMEAFKNLFQKLLGFLMPSTSIIMEKEATEPISADIT